MEGFTRLIIGKLGARHLPSSILNITVWYNIFLLLNNFLSSFPVLRDEFLESPSNRSVSIGDKAKFTCRPPRGEPTPKVLWMKGRKFLTDSGRIQISENGDLIISQVSLKDADDYKCIATNTAGERESAPARLTVLGTFSFFTNY